MFLKNDWIDALTSGKYTQATGQLYKNGGHCCLGVLCEILDLEKYPEEIEEAFEVSYAYMGTADEFSLPGTLADDLELDEGIVKELIAMNDEENRSFDFIAGYLSQVLPEDFGERLDI